MGHEIWELNYCLPLNMGNLESYIKHVQEVVYMVHEILELNLHMDGDDSR